MIDNYSMTRQLYGAHIYVDGAGWDCNHWCSPGVPEVSLAPSTLCSNNKNDNNNDIGITMTFVWDVPVRKRLHVAADGCWQGLLARNPNQRHPPHPTD